MSAADRCWLVVDPSAAQVALCAVRRRGEAMEVIDRALLLPRDEAAHGLGADAPALAGAVDHAVTRLAARGVRSAGAPLWLVPRPWRRARVVATAPDPAHTIPLGAAVALGAEQLRLQAGEDGADRRDALHLGFGADAGLVRCEGRVQLRRDGSPVDPRDLADDRPRALGAYALGVGDPLDAHALLDAWRSQVPTTPDEPLWPLRALAYPSRRAAAGDVVALALATASRQALGRLLGELLSLWDVAVVTLHLGDPCLATWLGLDLADGASSGLSDLDGASTGEAGRSAAAHSFASMRQGTTLRWSVIDPDAAALGAVRWHLRLRDGHEAGARQP